jgi:hypothetical protein
LITGINYKYALLGVNAAGQSVDEGDPIEPSDVFLAANKPGKAQAPAYVSSTTSSITIRAISPDVDDGGIPIIRYRIYADDGTVGSDFNELTSLS